MSTDSHHSDLSFAERLLHGRSFHQSGDLQRALHHYKIALELNPEHPDPLYLSGLVFFRTGNMKEAFNRIAHALQVAPAHGMANASMGQLLQNIERHSRAIRHFELAARADPQKPEVYNALGCSLASLDQTDAAIQTFQRALELKPDMQEARLNLANQQRRCGFYIEAENNYLQCLKMNPEFVIAHCNLAGLYQQQQKTDAGFYHAERALALEMDSPTAHVNLGSLLCDKGQFEQALCEYQIALDLDPSLINAYINAGSVLLKLGKHGLARHTFDVASEIAPDNVMLPWARCIAMLQRSYQSTMALDEARTWYAESLDALGRQQPAQTPLQKLDLVQIISVMQPFLLPYQGHNDRELQTKFGDIVGYLLPEQERQKLAPRRRGPIRVGIVSAFFHDHSNWKIPIRGWINALSSEFELYGYYTGIRNDAMTQQAREICDFFREQQSVTGFANSIRSDQPDILIYPEIGMHPVTFQLALERLAPVQCVSWGHPVTSGLKSMDYFLSSELMEPEDGDTWYRENLIRLKGLSFTHSTGLSVECQTDTSFDFGFGADQVIYLCVQNLGKYLPRYDWVFPEIISSVGNGLLVFIEDVSETAKLLRQRLSESFDKAGISFEKHVLFLPRLHKDQYRDLNRQADIFLDTPEWSGCNSIMEAFQFDVPVVTLPGRSMRSRHGYAIYRQMKYSALIAQNIEHFLELAIRLGIDPEWRQLRSQEIAQSKWQLYNDTAPVNHLVQFIRQTVEAGLSRETD